MGKPERFTDLDGRGEVLAFVNRVEEPAASDKELPEQEDRPRRKRPRHPRRWGTPQKMRHLRACGR